jgi:hypothetical protein
MIKKILALGSAGILAATSTFVANAWIGYGCGCGCGNMLGRFACTNWPIALGMWGPVSQWGWPCGLFASACCGQW